MTDVTNPEAIEAEIIEKGLTAPRVTLAQINELVDKIEYHVYQIPETTTIHATAFLNGFSLAIGVSACASPENFDFDIGKKLALQDAKEKATNELWKLEGYHLKKSLSA